MHFPFFLFPFPRRDKPTKEDVLKVSQQRSFECLSSDAHLSRTFFPRILTWQPPEQQNQKQKQEEDWVLANKVSQCQSLKAAASPDKQTTRGETDSLCKFLGLDLLRLASSLLPRPVGYSVAPLGGLGKYFNNCNEHGRVW